MLVLYLMLGVDQQVEKYLESILSGEALVAVSTRERFHCKMYPLVPFEIVVPVETLRALVAPEWTVVLQIGLLLCVVAIKLMHLCGMAAVERRHDTLRHATIEHRERCIHTGKNRAWHGVAVRSVLLSELGLVLWLMWLEG